MDANIERHGFCRISSEELTDRMIVCDKKESVYLRYAIVLESDPSEGVAKLEVLHQDNEKDGNYSKVLSIQK